MVEQRTGRELRMQGELSLSFFPSLGLETGPVSLSGPAGGEFASAKSVQVDAALLPLLSGRLQVDSLLVEQPSLRLVRSDNGSVNWRLHPGDGGDAGRGGRALSIEDMEIDGGQVYYLDQRTGREYTLHELDLSVENLLAGGPGETALKLAFRITSPEPKLDAQVEGGAALVRTGSKVSVRGMDFSAQGESAAAPGGELDHDITGSASFDWADNRLEADLTVDGEPITAQATLPGPDSNTLAFSVTAGEVNLDRYLSAAGPKQPAQAEQDQPAVPEHARTRLAELDVDGSVDIERLTVAGLTLSELRAELKGKDGRVTAKPLQAQVYNGRVNATVQADLTKSAPSLEMEADAVSLSLGDLLADFAGSRPVTGVADLDFKATAGGASWPDLRRSLQGVITFTITDGAFHGFQIVPKGTAKQFKQSKERDKIASAQKKQSFHKLSGSINISGAKLSNKDLRLDADNLEATGEGGLDLAQRRVDYLALVDITGVPTLPIRIRGPLSGPTYGFDPVEFASIQAGAAADLLQSPVKLGGAAVKGVGKGAEAVGKGIGKGVENVGEGVKGLFDGGDEKN
jgi:AsmA protein